MIGVAQGAQAAVTDGSVPMKAMPDPNLIPPLQRLLALACLGLALAACARDTSAQAAAAAREAAPAESAHGGRGGNPGGRRRAAGARPAGLLDPGRPLRAGGGERRGGREDAAGQRHPGPVAQRPVLRLLQALRHAGPGPGRAAPRPAGEGRGLGLHRQLRRLHPHQHPRGGERPGSDRAPHRPARVCRQGDRGRRAHRRRGDQDQRQQPADRQARRSHAPQARAVGARHRLAVRLREQRHRRHHQRHRALGAGRELRALHPDRRRGQPGQLRRPAVQPAGRGDRHQLADLQPHRRLHGGVVRHPDRRGAQRRGAAHQDRPRGARPHRRHASRTSTRSWPSPSASTGRTARWCPRWRRTARPRRPASSPAT